MIKMILPNLDVLDLQIQIFQETYQIHQVQIANLENLMHISKLVINQLLNLMKANQ